MEILLSAVRMVWPRCQLLLVWSSGSLAIIKERLGGRERVYLLVLAADDLGRIYAHPLL
jgi:hypothetical protein